MRKLLFKNFVSSNKRRKELLMSEHFEAKGIVQDFEKRIVYSVQQIYPYSEKNELEEFLNQKVQKDSPPQTFVIKTRDNLGKRETTIHKVSGLQYIVLKDKVVILKAIQLVKKTVLIKNEKFISAD